MLKISQSTGNNKELKELKSKKEDDSGMDNLRYAYKEMLQLKYAVNERDEVIENLRQKIQFLTKQQKLTNKNN